jgi:hypothetical protein
MKESFWGTFGKILFGVGVGAFLANEDIQKEVGASIETAANKLDRFFKRLDDNAKQNDDEARRFLDELPGKPI